MVTVKYRVSSVVTTQFSVVKNQGFFCLDALQCSSGLGCYSIDENGKVLSVLIGRKTGW